MSDDPKLSNIRDHLGWLIGKKVVEVTDNDPPGLPDHDPEDFGIVTLHFDNGGTLELPLGADGFTYHDPDAKDEPE